MPFKPKHSNAALWQKLVYYGFLSNADEDTMTGSQLKKPFLYFHSAIFPYIYFVDYCYQISRKNSK